MAERTQQAAHEEDLRRLWQEGRWDAATERLLRCYGREIAEFLAALHRSDADGGEVFSLFAEGVWRGMAKFEGACSFRTWAYAVARLNSLRYRRDGRTLTGTRSYRTLLQAARAVWQEIEDADTASE